MLEAYQCFQGERYRNDVDVELHYKVHFDNLTSEYVLQLPVHDKRTGDPKNGEFMYYHYSNNETVKLK